MAKVMHYAGIDAIIIILLKQLHEIKITVSHDIEYITMEKY